jgi:hypothetical protein
MQGILGALGALNEGAHHFAYSHVKAPKAP